MKYMKYLRWAVNNTWVQSFIKARVSTKVWTAIVAIVMATGLTTTPVIETITDTTTEGITATVMENGGGAVRSLWQEDEAEIETGLVEEEPEVEPVSSGFTYELPKNANTWSDVKRNGIYEREREQRHGTCVFESYDIITIEALEYLGLNPTTNGDDPFIDINHGYLAKTYQPGVDSGSVPSWVFKKYVDEGLPIRTTYQDDDQDRLSFQEMKKRADQDVYNYKVKAPFKMLSSGRGPDTLMRDIDKFKAQGKNIMFRISKRNHSNVAWFHETTPYIKDPVARKTGGGHSMAGAGSYGVFEYKGEPTIYIHESAGSVRYHLARKSVLEMVMTSWEIYEPIGEAQTPEQVIAQPSPAPVPPSKPISTDVLSDTIIRYGHRTEAVTALQTYLQAQGIIIPAGSTGFFGNQTKTALDQWQDLHFGNIYNGTVWGPVSQERYRLIQTQ